MGILITGLTGNEMLDIKNFSTFPQRLGMWKCQECLNCGNPFRIPTIAWKSLRLSHIPLQNPSGFTHSHIPSSLTYNLIFVFLFTEGLVFLFTAVVVKLLTERLVFLLDFYICQTIVILASGAPAGGQTFEKV